jgi:hypothetical protein
MADIISIQSTNGERVFSLTMLYKNNIGTEVVGALQTVTREGLFKTTPIMESED